MNKPKPAIIHVPYLLGGYEFGRHLPFYLLAWILLACHLLLELSTVVQTSSSSYWASGEYIVGIWLLISAIAMKALCLAIVLCAGPFLATEALLGVGSPLQSAWNVRIQSAAEVVTTAEAPEHRSQEHRPPSDGKPQLADIRSAKATECLEIIATKKITSKDLVNALTKEESRARPNQRLLVGFGINNCFTTTDPADCKAFRDIVEKLIYIDDDQWKKLAVYVQRVAQDELATPATLTLFTVVQELAMKAVIYRLFDRDTHKKELDSSIRDLADEINQQWVRSKGQYDPGTQPTWAFENSPRLQAVLKTVFSDYVMEDSENNPLNLILPGYETLWRVVLRCFIELTARSHDDASSWCASLQKFVNDPNITQLDDVAKVGVCATNISQEALRVYPPTRRIYREYETGDGETYQAATDIESLHRGTATWGLDAALFRPERWNGKFDNKDAQDRVFMPFGAKPFACPAKRRPGLERLPFGVSMIALLVGVLTAETEGKWKLVGKLPRDGEPLGTDREAYGDLMLERIPDEAALPTERDDADELVR